MVSSKIKFIAGKKRKYAEIQLFYPYTNLALSMNKRSVMRRAINFLDKLINKEK